MIYIKSPDLTIDYIPDYISLNVVSALRVG